MNGIGNSIPNPQMYPYFQQMQPQPSPIFDFQQQTPAAIFDQYQQLDQLNMSFQKQMLLQNLM